MKNFICSVCGQSKQTGYATRKNGDKVCYDCCGEEDKQWMIDNGSICLYLTCEKTKGTISNWPGTLSFTAYITVGRHNIAGNRYDAWFTGPDGKKWHGVTYGDNTQICHCKKIKG